MKLKIGDKVRLQGGGVNDGKAGIIIDPKEIKTSGRGVPLLPGHYKPADWSKEYAIKLDDGEIVTEFKKSAVKVDDTATSRLVVETLAELVMAKKIPPKTDTAKWNQHKIALDTVKNPAKGFLGGPTAEESKKTLKDLFGYTDEDIKKIEATVLITETLAELVTSEADDTAVRELEIYIDNEVDLYEKYKMPFFKNLSKRMQQNKYDPKLAPKLFYALVDVGAKKYTKDHADPKEWNTIFTPETRKKVAENLAKEFEDAYKNKEYDFMKVEAAAPFKKYVNIHEEDSGLRPDSYYIKEIDNVLKKIAEIDKETAKELDEKLAKTNLSNLNLKVWLEEIKQAYNDLV